MDHQQPFYSSQALFDPIIGSFDHDLDHLLISNASFINNVFDSDMVFPLDAAVNTEVEETSRKSNSGGRMKTLAFERRRRSKMKEKLYGLRSLVPNITKMDKASIIADAVVYVQRLQDQAKGLRNEILALEPVSVSPDEDQATRVVRAEEYCKILSVAASEVGGGRFHVRVESSRGDGAASAIYSAIKSLRYLFHLENSSFSSASGRSMLTLYLNVQDCGSAEVTTVASVTAKVMGALLKEGFRCEMQNS